MVLLLVILSFIGIGNSICIGGHIFIGFGGLPVIGIGGLIVLGVIALIYLSSSASSSS